MSLWWWIIGLRWRVEGEVKKKEMWRRESQVVALMVNSKAKLEMLKGDEKEYMVKKGEGGCRLGEQ